MSGSVCFASCSWSQQERLTLSEFKALAQLTLSKHLSAMSTGLPIPIQVVTCCLPPTKKPRLSLYSESRPLLQLFLTYWIFNLLWTRGRARVSVVQVLRRHRNPETVRRREATDTVRGSSGRAQKSNFKMKATLEECWWRGWQRVRPVASTLGL